MPDVSGRIQRALHKGPTPPLLALTTGDAREQVWIPAHWQDGYRGGCARRFGERLQCEVEVDGNRRVEFVIRRGGRDRQRESDEGRRNRWRQLLQAGGRQPECDKRVSCGR